MDWIDEVVRDVAELPDRTSPDGQPEMMLVSAEELRSILAANSEIAHVRTLATDAYAAWDGDNAPRVGKLLRAILDSDFRRIYRPDLHLRSNAGNNLPPHSGGQVD